MRRRIYIGRLMDLDISTAPSAAAGFTIVAVVLAQVARRWLRLRPSQAVAGGLLGATAHLLSELWHQLGHARAARRVGYPMCGIHFWGVLGTSRYPRDEEVLRPEVHITRALGGPQASLLLFLSSAAAALLLRPLNNALSFVASFTALDNLLVFILGALTPLPVLETDGTTILRQLRQRPAQRIVLPD
jgi:Zn-dependent protease